MISVKKNPKITLSILNNELWTTKKKEKEKNWEKKEARRSIPFRPMIIKKLMKQLNTIEKKICNGIGDKEEGKKII